MGSFSNYLENKLVDHVVGKTSFTMPTAYIALSTADPLDTGAGLAEPVGNGYARKATVGADWAAAANGATSNATALAFPQATGAWGTVTHFTIMDAATAGNMLAHGTLAVAKPITTGDTPSFAIGDLGITLD